MHNIYTFLPDNNITCPQCGGQCDVHTTDRIDMDDQPILAAKCLRRVCGNSFDAVIETN